MKKLIQKFITNTINSQELNTLRELLKVSKNQRVFKNYVKDYTDVNLLMLKVNVDEAYKKVLEEINEKKRPVKSIIPSLFKYAAMFIGLIGFFYFFQYNESKENQISTTNKKVNSNSITLTLNNGKNIILDTKKKYSSSKVKGNSKELLYLPEIDKNNSYKELNYNYLTIPRGSEFFVQLSDGTKIWLNSGSKLKYPENFHNGETRKIELVYGEAYFEVSPSSKHNGDSFHVITKNQEVKVLGTHFNVKAYKEDNLISTTLLEGKVNVNSGLNSILLKPNQQSKVFNKSNLIKVSDIDVSHEVAWVKGMFSFNEKSLEDIMKILSRWYNVEVIFESDKIKKHQFTAVLERKTSLKEILNFFKSTSSDFKYTLKDKIIRIK